MYWKRLFKPHILDRGYGYYQEKMIKVQKLVYDADEKMIRDYMTSILMNDDKLLTRFSIMLQEDINGDNINMYISQIDDIACRYLGLDGFIDYYRAGDFISELEDIYDNDVRYIISKGKYMKAFNIINYIFMLIGDIDMDDSDGGIGILADKTYEIWLELLHKVNDKDKQNMYEWFITHLNGVIIDYLEDYIERILIEEFKEQEYLEPKLIMIESKLKELVVDVENPSWNKEYMIGKWVTRYIDLLENYQYKLENIEKLYKEFWNNSQVRNHYIARCEKDKKYDEALKVIEESILLDSGHRGLIVDYANKKKEIYLIQGNMEAYKKQMWDIVLKHEVGDIDSYKELRNLYTKDEWKEKREIIFKQLPKYAHVERLYKEEKLYDRLLEYVINTDGMYGLQEYAGILKDIYPKEILDKYVVELNKYAIYSGDRKKYRDIVAVLNYMKAIAGGIEVVSEIVEQWKIKYRNRPAMMDELSKIIMK